MRVFKSHLEVNSSKSSSSFFVKNCSRYLTSPSIPGRDQQSFSFSNTLSSISRLGIEIDSEKLKLYSRIDSWEPILNDFLHISWFDSKKISNIIQVLIISAKIWKILKRFNNWF